MSKKSLVKMGRIVNIGKCFLIRNKAKSASLYK